MRKIISATSALLLLGASAGFAQELGPRPTSNDLPSNLRGTVPEDVDPMPTAGIPPMRALDRGYQAADAVRPSEEDDLPEGFARDDSLFDNEINPSAQLSASPILRPLAGQETETFSARDENTLPEAQPVPGG